MKIVFLDIDGVINSMDFLHARHTLTRTRGEEFRRFDDHGDEFDPRCVMHLESILRKSGAKIVISSTWRHAGLSAMRQMWADRGLYGEVVGITPSRPGNFRGYEISQWLKESQDTIEGYVILDDDTDFLPHQMERFVRVNEDMGLTYETALLALEILETH